MKTLGDAWYKQQNTDPEYNGAFYVSALAMQALV